MHLNPPISRFSLVWESTKKSLGFTLTIARFIPDIDYRNIGATAFKLDGLFQSTTSSSTNMFMSCAIFTIKDDPLYCSPFIEFRIAGSTAGSKPLDKAHALFRCGAPDGYVSLGDECFLIGKDNAITGTLFYADMQQTATTMHAGQCTADILLQLSLAYSDCSTFRSSLAWLSSQNTPSLPRRRWQTPSPDTRPRIARIARPRAT